MNRAGLSHASANAEPAPPRPAAPAGPATAAERIRLAALAAMTAILIGLCALVAFPFLPAITWGVALAVIAWPLHRGVGRHVQRPGLAAGVTSAAVVALILGPAVF